MDKQTLNLSPTLSIPIEAVTQTFGILAKRGMGKTYTALVMVEELLQAKQQVVIADPVGVCWGLRSSANGKSAGLSILVLGGDHADLPLLSTSGEIVADFIVSTGQSAVLDLSLMSGGEMIRFMADFAERLYQKNRRPMHLVLDEADAFAPQRPMPGETRMLGAIDKIVRRGRARGLGVSLITQRPAALNKNVLTQIEVLVLLRLIAPQDRNAVEAWIEVHGTTEQQRELMGSLPSLEVGEAWVWSPGWLDLFQRVRIRKRITFDSSSTPKAGQRIQMPDNFAAVDLDQLTKHMAATVEQAAANDPKALKKRVATLEAELKQRPAAEPIRVEVPALKPEEIEQLKQCIGIMAETADSIKNIAAIIGNSLDLIGRTGQLSRPAPITPKPAAQSVKRTVQVQPAGAGEKLSSGIRKILTALAQYPEGRTKVKIGILTGYAHSGGGFNNYLSTLRTNGWITSSGDRNQITDAGLAALGPYTPLPGWQELAEYWYSRLGKAERAILQTLIESYPSSLSKDEVATRTGYEGSGGGFNNALSKLRTLELISGRGEMAASDAFFEGGQ